MILSANRDDCLEFDAAAFAQEAEKISVEGHFLPNEVGCGCSLLWLNLCHQLTGS